MCRGLRVEALILHSQQGHSSGGVAVGTSADRARASCGFIVWVNQKYFRNKTIKKTI
jgi:hypothetical protein